MESDKATLTEFTLDLNHEFRFLFGITYTTLCQTAPSFDPRGDIVKWGYDQFVESDGDNSAAKFAESVAAIIGLRKTMAVTGDNLATVRQNKEQVALIEFTINGETGWALGDDGAAYRGDGGKTFKMKVGSSTRRGFEVSHQVAGGQIDFTDMDQFGRVVVPADIEFARIGNGFDISDSLMIVERQLDLDNPARFMRDPEKFAHYAEVAERRTETQVIEHEDELPAPG